MSSFTQYHSKYYANILTLQNKANSIDRLSQSIFNAKIDLNPHQVESALFAFKSPLSSGVVLADEVGLGKTIEAGLVITQYWSERKRKIIIIAPSSLRKQWSMELKEKFFLDSLIIDGTIYKKMSENSKNIFEQKDKIIIVSYEFAAKHSNKILLANFELAVIDEAHKLRNYHKLEKAKIAFSIYSGLLDTKKILLTATPLQNSILEIFSLVSFIDDFVFGDKKSFIRQFPSSSLDKNNTSDLKDRLKEIVKRTLRKDVVEYINYTKRIPIVQEFTPSKKEIVFYELISNFTLNEESYSIPSAQKSLITLIVRKLLASSTTAIMGTLETFITRLNEDIDNLNKSDTPLDTEEKKHLSKKDIPSIKKEIKQLKNFIKLAKEINIDTKSKSLLIALEKGFNAQKELGVKNQKAIIFTESTRTQKFLFDYLETKGFKNKVVLFNGVNTDNKSKEIYKAWLEKYKNSDKITGAKSADMKQSIVDYFRETASIMISTEAGSEGINLQFCSMLVNYDLPWNPQRIEQRIGRVHRYGQKFDVIVINFLNIKNAADKRVYEILSNKFHLFEGVFGASDEVLGSIEDNIDFEDRLLKIYKTCRSNTEIKEAFDKLQDDMSEKIEKKTIQTRKALFDHFDRDVHLRLKDTELKSNEVIDRFSNIFWQITQIELEKNATFNNEKKEFNYKKKHYKLISSIKADSNKHIYSYRLNSPLGEEVIEKAKQRKLPQVKLIFDLTNNKYKISILDKYKGSKGFIRITKISIKSYDLEEHLIVTALTSDYILLDEEISTKILSLNAKKSTKVDIKTKDIKKINNEYDKQKNILIKENESTNETHFKNQSIKLHKWADDKLISIEKELKDTKVKIKELNRKSIDSQSNTEQTEIQLKIKSQEKKRRKIQREIFDIEEEIEEQRDELITKLKKDKEPTITTNELFTIQWEII